MNPKMYPALLKQMNEELSSGLLYLHMARIAKQRGWHGAVKWLTIQAKEEFVHFRKFRDYLVSNGKAIATNPAFDAGYWLDMSSMFHAVLKHEKHISAGIRDLADRAKSLSDKDSLGFLKWFVVGQVKEENRATEVLEQIGKGEGHADRFLASRTSME